MVRHHNQCQKNTIVAELLSSPEGLGQLTDGLTVNGQTVDGRTDGRFDRQTDCQSDADGLTAGRKDRWSDGRKGNDGSGCFFNICCY